MKCADFRQEIVHVLLRQAEPAVASDCAAHARLCGACRTESASIAATLRGVRQASAANVSESFRQRLRARVAHDAVAERELLGTASLRDRLLASGAFLLHRVRQSPALQILTGVAAIQLGAVIVYLALIRGEAPEAAQHALGPAPVATTPPAASGERPQPLDPPPSALPEARSDLVDGARVDPADYADPQVIEHPVKRPDLADEIEPFAPDFGVEVRELAESDNRLAHVRYLMRLRLRSQPAGEPRERTPINRAVLAGMRWLVDRQERDGSWDPGAAGGDSLARVGVTGLVVAALSVDAGVAIPAGVQQQTIARGLRFLRESLDESTGTYGRVIATADHEALTLFNHAMATLAFAENYVLQSRADQAILKDALLRLDDLGGQRMHRDLEPVDGTTAPWVALAFETAAAAGIRCEFNLARAAGEARQYVVRDLPPANSPLYNERMWQAVTASAIDPLFDGERDPRVLRPSVDRVLGHLLTPEWREPTKIYFAALDLYLRGDPEWTQWQEQAGRVLLDSQLAAGSFESEYTWDRVSTAGGTLYTTALHVMTLSVPYRHAR